MEASTYGALIALIKKTLEGGGAIKGKNCTIQSIGDIEGGHRVTFKWTLDDGTVQTNYIDVLDGEKGDKGDKGDRGAIGPSGAQGIQGVQGPAGPKGDTGAQGIQGIQGAQGIQGIQGPKGDDGYPFLIYKQYDDISEFDAEDFPEIGLMFMVMVEDYDPQDPTQSIGYPIYRYTGEGNPPYSLVVHLASQGIKGEKGDKGDKGDQGVPGQQGEQGEKGDKGEKGDTGAQGIQGEQGIGLPNGGLTGQVLAKYSNEDYDFDWMGTTDTVRPDSTALVQSRAVYSAINNALSSIYTPRGELSCEELTSELLIDANVGNIYEMSDAGETTALFINGAGKTINIGDNVGIIKAGANTYLFNLMANAFDLTDYQKKDLVSPVESQTTVESALQALSRNKISKANNPTNGDIAILDANGNLVDSGVSKDNVVYNNTPMASFQCSSGGAVGYADLGIIPNDQGGSQAFSFLEIEYGRVDGLMDKYLISIGGQGTNDNYIKVVRLVGVGAVPVITVDNNKHIWMSMDTYVYAHITAYGKFTIVGTVSRTAPTGTALTVHKLVTENDLSDFRSTAFKIHVLNSSNPMSWTQNDNKVALLSATISDGTYVFYTVATGWGGTVVPVKISGTADLSITKSGNTITVSCSAGTFLCGVFMTP